MIKFFRKIRQKLLSENKFSKYLIYAIGEIVLVVIGILIALQFNNWNERKNEEKTVKALFLDVQKDLLNDIEEASLIIEWYEELDSISRNIYNNKYSTEDYKSAKSKSMYNAGLTYYPLQLSKQSFETLNANKELIPDEYKELLKNLNSIYIEQSEFLDIQQNKSVQIASKYYEHLYANYDWIINFKKDNYTEEIINYFANSTYHKRQVLLWNDYTNRAYQQISKIKSDAIVNALIIHSLFTPGKELPDILSKLSINFKKNNMTDFLGNYETASDDVNYQIYTKYNLFLWEDSNNSKIYGDGMPLIEIAKDTLGFAIGNNFSMAFKRDSIGNIISMNGLSFNKKVIEFKKVADD